ncbi:PREDICTED: prostatic acid phosphatase-like [Diuraphis noxia]|uniref:prostatic acid phosphatase-like n=1 Tax=Diuraphis noxia TaxID=143948 RepID=UPI0007638738|nr:PREDICTED: prostatic acid phosphatase-like [Diuraphis noxia]
MNVVKSTNNDFALCVLLLIFLMCPGAVFAVHHSNFYSNEQTVNKFDSNTLRLVHAVFRHGQRTPADTYPLDPYSNSSWEPFGWGQLTNNGRRKQYELGKFIRKRYSGFLDILYSSKKVTFKSTDVDRTLMSAQLVASAMYKPVGVQQWNRYLEWQPVPIHSEPLKDDRLLLVRIDCPRYYEERQKIMNSNEVLKELNTYSDLYSYLSKHTGLTIQDPDDVQSIYSTLKAESDYGVTLPSWTSKVYPTKLAKVTSRSFILNAYNDEMKKLKGGPLLKQILENSQNKINKQSTHQLYAYAGHDSTVSNLLISLGVWDEQIPTYNMLALLELHESKKGNFYLKVFLRNESSSEPYRLQIPNCKEDLCTLEHISNLTSNVIPLNLNEECKTDNPEFSNLIFVDRGP